MKFAAALVIGAFVFTACEDDDVILSAPADTTLDLGAEFNPMDGVSVDGMDIEDVTWNAVPEWNIYEVNHYVFTYTAGDQVADRNVFIQVDELLGIYEVTDEDDDGTSYEPYLVTVSKGSEYNTLRFSELFYPDIFINAEVNGGFITIPEQTFFDNTVTIEGTGSYDGETRKILVINYNIVDNGETFVGTSTFD